MSMIAGIIGASAGAAAGISGVLLGRRNARRAGAEVSWRRAWRSDGVEHHVVAHAAAAAFFTLTVAIAVYGLAQPVFDLGGINPWLAWTVAWTVFAAAMVHQSRQSS